MINTTIQCNLEMSPESHWHSFSICCLKVMFPRSAVIFLVQCFVLVLPSVAPPVCYSYLACLLGIVFSLRAAFRFPRTPVRDKSFVYLSLHRAQLSLKDGASCEQKGAPWRRSPISHRRTALLWDAMLLSTHSASHYAVLCFEVHTFTSHDAAGITMHGRHDWIIDSLSNLLE